MLARFRPKPRGDDGASAVEFALVLPILLIIVLGTIVFGLAIFTLITAQHTAREAARQVAVGGFTSCSGTSSSSDLSWYIANDLGLSSAAVTNVKLRTIDQDANGADPGDKAQISFSVPSDSGMNGAFKGVLNILPGGTYILPPTFSITADTRVEQVGGVTSCG